MDSMEANTARRLAMVRLLLERAERDLELPPPLFVDSINRLHDAVEMFLALAVQHLDQPIPKQFMAYWDVLGTVLGRPLSYRSQIQRFNAMRVNLKHYGIEPAKHEARMACVSVQGFISDECGPLFGIGLDEVSLSRFVACASARSLVEEAEHAWSDGRRHDAFEALGKAFQELISDYKRRKILWYGQSVFESLEATVVDALLSMDVGPGNKSLQDSILLSLGALDSLVGLLSLGIDVRRYGRFRGLIPRDHRVILDPPGKERTERDFEYCRDFVITSALHLAEIDYEFDLWTHSRSPAEW